VGDVHVKHSELTGVSVGGSDIPLIIDEIPALAACALFANGDTVVDDAGELRIKESDRIGSIVNMITAFGGEIEARQQGFTVHGGSGCRSAQVNSFADHRIAMAASILALASEGSSIIQNADCVNISFPEFFQVLDRFST
jgi:3-phosphoshikimate 1-carboxyvinyltransferase